MKPEVTKIKSTVFENFTKLTLDDENARLNGAASLIQHLEKSSEKKVNKSMDVRPIYYKIFNLGTQLCIKTFHKRQWIVNDNIQNRILYSSRWFTVIRY